MASAGYSLRMLGEDDTYDAAALRQAEDAINRSGSARARSPSALMSASSSFEYPLHQPPPRQRRTPSLPPEFEHDEEEVTVAAGSSSAAAAAAAPLRVPTPRAEVHHHHRQQGGGGGGRELNPFESDAAAAAAVAAGAGSASSTRSSFDDEGMDGLANSGIGDGGGGGGNGGDSSDSDPEFDIVEDIFQPMQQIRLRKKKWKQKMQLSKRCAVQTITSSVPALHWLPRYVIKRDLLSDVIAGCMLSVVSVPQGMAYALLGGLSPIYGLYSCLIPPLLYAFLGCSRTMHVGPVAVMCLLLGNAITDVAPLGANAAFKEDAAILLSMLVGLVLLATSVLRLGFAVSFLSDSVLSAYNCASAFLIFTSQLGSFVGIKVPAGFGFVETFAHLFAHAGDINACAVLLGLGTVALILAVDHINLTKKPRIPIPTQLVAVVVGTLISYAGDLHLKYGLAIIGKIPTGLPMPSFPGASTSRYQTLLPDGSVDTEAAPLTLLNFAQIKALMQPACMLALVSYVISISIAKDFAIRDNEKRIKQIKEQKQQAEAAAASGSPVPVAPSLIVEEEVVIDANQELFALGVSNLLGGFFGAFPTGGALSRTVLVYNAGVRTSLSVAFSVLVLVFVLLFLTPLLASLPFTVLAAIVFTALRTLLMQVKESKRLFNLRRQDFLMWSFTFGCTLLFDTQTGIAAGLVTSLLMLLKQTSRPPSSTLGRLPQTDMYRDVRFHPLAQSYRGVLVFRWDAPLHFANAAYFKMKLDKHMKKAALLDYKQHRSLEQQAEDQAAADARNAEGIKLHELHKTIKVRWEKHVEPLVAQVGSRLRNGLTRGESSANKRNSMRMRLQRTPSIVQLPEDPELDMNATQIHEAANINEALALQQQQQQAGEHQQHGLQRQHSRGDSSAAGSSSSSAPAAAAAAAAAPVTLEDCRIRYVVIDCSAIIDVDDTALKMLMALAGQLQVQLAFCMLNTHVRELLGRVHLFDAAALAAMETAATARDQQAAAAAAGGHRIDVNGAAEAAAAAAEAEADMQEELGLARPWGSVHQAVKFVVEHLREQRQRGHHHHHALQPANPPAAVVATTAATAAPAHPVPSDEALTPPPLIPSAVPSDAPLLQQQSPAATAFPSGSR